MSKEVKKVYQNLINIDLENLEKLIPLVVEFEALLKQLNSTSIAEFVLKINEKTNFTNANVSASCFNLENEYNRLLELEKLIGNRLTSENLTASKELKSTLIATITAKHTDYFTPGELKVKNDLDLVIKTFNLLDHQHRQQIGFNLKNELAYTPFAEFRGQSN
jgi:hypothetical protein